MEHRKVLQVRVCIACENAGQNATIKPPGVRGRASGRIADERRQILVGRIIFIVSTSAAEKLVEFLEMPLCAATQAVKAPDDQGLAVNAFDLADININNIIVR